MLMLTHTWILREFLVSAQCPLPEIDAYTYNVVPDLLPIYKGITSDLTHAIPRLGPDPSHDDEKIAFVRFHLLVDDLVHYGRILDGPLGRFDPEPAGYTYRRGRALIDPIRRLYRGLGREIEPADAAYWSHIMIEMAFDLMLSRGEDRVELIKRFCASLSYTASKRINPFCASIARLYGIPLPVVSQALQRGYETFTPEHMEQFVTLEGRVGICVGKFGLERDDPAVWRGVTDLMHRALDQVTDLQGFLEPTLKAIRASGWRCPVK